MHCASVGAHAGQHRMAAYVAERDRGGDVAALQRAVREQYEIDKNKGVAK